MELINGSVEDATERSGRSTSPKYSSYQLIHNGNTTLNNSNDNVPCTKEDHHTLSNQGFSAALQVVDTRSNKNSNKRDYPACSLVNVIKTVATYVAFFGAGMGTSILGATILQLEDQTNSTTEEIASLFTWKALGLLIGNVFIGVVFDRFPPEIILSLACLVMSVVVAATPFCTSLVTLTTVIVINGLMHGILGAGNSYMIKTWRLKAPPFLQALHFIISFGSCFSPVIVDLFLSDTYSMTGTLNGTRNDSNKTERIKPLDETADHMFFYNGSQNDGLPSVVEEVNSTDVNFFSDVYNLGLFYPYVITALCFLCACVGYAWALFLDVFHFKKKSLKRVDSFLRQQKEKSGPIKNKPLLVILLIYIMIYGGLECTYGAWILAFSVKYLKISFESATFIATAFWASFAGGRAISIFTSKMFSPVSVTCVCLSVSVTALLVETLACTLHPAVTWVCSIVVGLSFAPLFGNCIAFSQQKLNISGRATTAFVFFLFVGFMGMPALVGVFFARYTPMFFLYLLSAGSIAIALIFFSIVVYMKIVKR